MQKKLAIIGVILLVIVIFYSLIKQASDSLQSESRLNTEQEKLLSLQKDNADLKNKLTEVNSLSFIESQARDRLNFARAKETVFIISQEELQKVLGVAVQQKEEIPVNWQGWLKLFWK